MKRILDFLNDLRANNNREWFNANKERYREAEAVFNPFAERLIALVGEFDPAVRTLTLRDCTYRIYRDTRFSHDKTPYKTHFGLYICPGGKKSGNAGYYFHIEPSSAKSERASSTETRVSAESRCGEVEGDNLTGGGMIGGHLLDAGIYMPEPMVLKSVRDEIFDNGEVVLAAISAAHTESGWELDMSNSLKRTPTGYPAGGKWDKYLKLKDFHIHKAVDDDYILSLDLAERAAADFRTTYDFMTLMQRAARFAHEEMY